MNRIQSDSILRQANLKGKMFFFLMHYRDTSRNDNKQVAHLTPELYTEFYTVHWTMLSRNWNSRDHWSKPGSNQIAAEQKSCSAPTGRDLKRNSVSKYLSKSETVNIAYRRAWQLNNTTERISKPASTQSGCNLQENTQYSSNKELEQWISHTRRPVTRAPCKHWQRVVIVMESAI